MYVHYLPDIFISLVCTIVGFLFARRVPRRYVPVIWFAIIFGWAGVALATVRVSRMMNHELVQWLRCFAIVISLLLLYAAAWFAVLRKSGAFEPQRRALLRASLAAATAIPAIVAPVAFIRRESLKFREVTVAIPNLPKALDGLRITQVSDIHLSPFLDEATLARAVGMANETRPHLTLITGDLISTKGDPLDTCLRHLADLRADSGVWGCMGNHEIYAESEKYTEREAAKRGIRFLRNEAVQLHFGDAALNLAGVDYQRKIRPYLQGAEALIAPGALNVLLSHNPDVFPVSEQKGFDLTISGHTHGGQVTVEILDPLLNPARYFTPYVYGLYERGKSKLWVTRGIGTIGIPARLGAPAEVVLLKLCAISS